MKTVRKMLMLLIVFCLMGTACAETMHFAPDAIADAFNTAVADESMRVALQETDEDTLLYINDAWNLALLFSTASDRCFLWIDANSADAYGNAPVIALANALQTVLPDFDAEAFLNWSDTASDNPAYYSADHWDAVHSSDEISMSWLIYSSEEE